MNENKHAPLPYRVDEERYIVDANSNDVADMDACHRTEAIDETAAFVVRACNAHYDLIAACEKLINYRNQNTLNFQLEKADTYIDMMRAAVEKATGGTTHV